MDREAHDVDIFNIIQKVQDTVIHLEVDEEQWKITQGSQRQAKYVWSPRAVSCLRLPDTPHAQKSTTIHAVRPEARTEKYLVANEMTSGVPRTHQGDHKFLKSPPQRFSFEEAIRHSISSSGKKVDQMVG